MGFERPVDEILSDELVTLAFLSEVQEANGGEFIGDRLKLQKTNFLLTYEYFRDRWKGLNYSFFRYRWGPFSKDLYQTEFDLLQGNLMNVTPHGDYRLTNTGKQLGEDFLNGPLATGDNRPFGQRLRKIAQSFGGTTTDNLMRHIYSMEVVPIGWQRKSRIEDIPLYADLTKRLFEEEARNVLFIPEAWTENLRHGIEYGT